MENAIEIPKALTEDLLRSLLESIDESAILLLDMNGLVRSWNSGAVMITQYPLGEAKGKDFSFLYSPEARTSGLPAQDRIAAVKGRKLQAERWFTRRDGTVFNARLSLTLALDDVSGEPIGFSAFIQDLTASALAEEQSEERLRLMVKGFQDSALFMLDPHGNIRSWNAGAARIKLYTAPEVVGKHFSLFYLPEDIRVGIPQRELDVAAKAGRFEEEGWRVRKDQSVFWANIIITALRDKAGNLTGFSSITRDLTARPAAPVPAAPDSVKKIIGGTGRILVVDDEELVRAAAARMLRTYGYETVLADGGQQALDRIRNEGKFDLVLLDLTMPGMSGAEVLLPLREISPDLPVILSTGYDKSVLDGRITPDPNLHFLQKPYTASDLAEQLRCALILRAAAPQPG